ncbi:MAG: acetyl-CoA carboxylase biotin carboxyl carrier protein [Clostridia bacterium]|nr:acetyl-CoA carboxylase biotin carboxyl carrier protein [Clostridia bacterium]
MEYEKIKQLIDDMGNSNLSSINIDFPDGTKISMTKEEKEVVTMPVKQERVIEKQEEKEEKQNTNMITSPMVGTFYLKPSPTSKPYVEIGQEVKKGDTLCIIEAMKLMNEIESEVSGKIVKVLLEDGVAVEYGTPLFEIEQ